MISEPLLRKKVEKAEERQKGRFSQEPDSCVRRLWGQHEIDAGKRASSYIPQLSSRIRTCGVIGGLNETRRRGNMTVASMVEELWRALLSHYRVRPSK